MTDMYCVIGKKLAHTLSPEIHRAYFELSGRQGEYTAVELTEEEIARGREFLLGYDGVNVTAINPCRLLNVAVRLSFFIDFV